MFQNNNTNNQINPSSEIKNASSIIPERPVNGALGFDLLKNNKVIEVKNKVAFWFAESIEDKADFNFCMHLDKFNRGWTALYRY